MPFLIDGHNLISALPDLSLADPDDEIQLVRRLKGWALRERRKAAVVFDAGLPGGRSRELSSGPVEVIFASVKGGADAVIRQRLRRLKTPREWTVVSSDRAIQASARAMGARVMSSQEFAPVLLPALPEIPEKPETVVAEELRAWLEMFPEPPSQATPKVKPAARPAVQPMRKESSEPVVRPTVGSKPAVENSTARKQKTQPAGGRNQSEPEEEQKPRLPDEDEIAAWLEIFKDPEPEPRVRRKVVRSRAPETKPEPARPSSPSTSPTSAEKKAVPRRNSDQEKPDSITQEELAEWLRIFGPRRSPKK